MSVVPLSTMYGYFLLSVELPKMTPSGMTV